MKMKSINLPKLNKKEEKLSENVGCVHSLLVVSIAVKTETDPWKDYSHDQYVTSFLFVLILE